MKRSAEGEDGPEQKYFASTSQQDGQAQGPLQLWSGTLEFQKKRPHSNDKWQPGYFSGMMYSNMSINTDNWTEQLQMTTNSLDDYWSNDQRQADQSKLSCKIHSNMRINTDNWPKQLKMTTISHDDYEKLWSLDAGTQIGSCIFSVDGDCDEQLRGALMQYTSRLIYRGCVLLEYTSSGIQVILLESWILNDEECVGYIEKYSNNGHNVKLLTDLGILSHAATYNMFSKENARLKEELQQKDKMLAEKHNFRRDEVEMLKRATKEGNDMMEKERDEMQRDRDVMQNQISERDRRIYQNVSALKEKDESLKKKDEQLQEKDEAISDRESNLVEQGTELMEKDDEIMTIKQEKDDLQRDNNEMRTRCSDLENQVLPLKAALGKIKKELQCGFCLRTIKKAITIECGHTFSNECLGKLLNQNATEPLCPFCRGRIHLQTCRPTFMVDNCARILKGEHMTEGSDDDSSSASSSSRSSSGTSSDFS